MQYLVKDREVAVVAVTERIILQPDNNVNRSVTGLSMVINTEIEKDWIKSSLC